MHLVTWLCYAAAGAGGLVSIYEVIVNPDFTDPWSSISYKASQAANLVRAGKQMLQKDAGPHVDQQCPLLLQLVSHIALEQNAGIVMALSMANRYSC